MFHKPIDEMFPNPPAGLDAHAFCAKTPCRSMSPSSWTAMAAGRRSAPLNRLKGHKAGIAAVRELIRAASDAGVRFLTIYSFSTENWKRPEEEVVGLMDLFAKTMLAEVDGLHAENVRVRTIGDISMLPQETRDAFAEAWEKTRNNTGMTLLVAVNYGSRQEMLRATQRCIDVAVARAMAGDAPHELPRRNSDAAFIPPIVPIPTW